MINGHESADDIDRPADAEEHKPARRRRTVSERLTAMRAVKQRELAKVVERENALLAALSDVTSARQRLVDELARIEAACGI